jgi:hypothetical protein
MMKQININILCILLVIILIAIIGYASMNKGRLWQSDEKFRPACCDTNSCFTPYDYNQCYFN